MNHLHQRHFETETGLQVQHSFLKKEMQVLTVLVIDECRGQETSPSPPPSPLAEKSTIPLSPNDDHNAHGNVRDNDEIYESFGNVRVVAFKKNWHQHQHQHQLL